VFFFIFYSASKLQVADICR